jgi:hypothetical protein
MRIPACSSPAAASSVSPILAWLPRWGDVLPGHGPIELTRWLTLSSATLVADFQLLARGAERISLNCGLTVDLGLDGLRDMPAWVHQ